MRSSPARARAACRALAAAAPPGSVPSCDAATYTTSAGRHPPWYPPAAGEDLGLKVHNSLTSTLVPFIPAVGRRVIWCARTDSGEPPPTEPGRRPVRFPERARALDAGTRAARRCTTHATWATPARECSSSAPLPCHRVFIVHRCERPSPEGSCLALCACCTALPHLTPGRACRAAISRSIFCAALWRITSTMR